MARSTYQNRFRIDQTGGGAEEFFGENVDALPESARPTLTIAIDAGNKVTFAVAQSSGVDDFVKAAEARFLDSTVEHWYDGVADLIVGDVHRGDDARRQLFVLWARVDPQAPDPTKNLRFGMYFFSNDSCLSCGDGDPFGGVGQASGGATGGGPH